MRPRRYYLDTSVLGGFYDAEFEVPTRTLFEEFRLAVSIGVISEVVLAELDRAPRRVRDLLRTEGPFSWEIVQETEESIELAEQYLSSGVVGPRFFDDCRHVAIATIEKVEVMLSWNLRHIVHYDKIRLFNAVNLIQGYGTLEIRTPAEVISYDE
ncbi:MAG: PIN domain protein [Candidatus Omnitrophica bacterium]|nr:PIN domain protein [Candidatus Omnitrophota bacterium]MCA9439937.1 PIN domain protein [Candidatus Omnitrophota bacterium]